LFDRQSALETQKLTDQKTQLERERQIVLARADAQLTASQADEKIFNQQSQLTLAQLKGYQSFTETVNTFVSATGDKSPFVQAVAEILGVAQGADAGAAFKDNLVKIPQQTADQLLEAITSTQGNINKQGEIFKLQRKGITDQAQGESNLNNLRQSGITGQIQNQQNLRIIERDILSTTLAGKAQELAAEIKLQQTKLDGLPLQELELRAQATQKIEELDQQRIKTLETLNQRVDTLARSEDRLGQALDQSQSIVKESFTGAFMKLNDALIDGSITMGMVANTFKDMVGNMLREIQQAVFRKTIVDPITDIISGSVGSLFGGAKTAAAGGAVHMAGGGMKRDRVPAMLEPGEFVMRKEAVKQAGVGTMMRMNAAPRGYQSGGIVGSDANKNTPYNPERAAQLMEMGIPAAAAVSIAQTEASKSTSDSSFSFSNSRARQMGIGSNMGLEPKYSAPVSGDQAIDAVNRMLGIGTKTRGTLTPSDLQSMQSTTPATTQTAGIFDFLDRGLSNKPGDVKKRKDRFKPGQKSKGKGLFERTIDAAKKAVGLASAGNIMNDASSSASQRTGGVGPDAFGVNRRQVSTTSNINPMTGLEFGAPESVMADKYRDRMRGQVSGFSSALATIDKMSAGMNQRSELLDAIVNQQNFKGDIANTAGKTLEYEKETDFKQMEAFVEAAKFAQGRASKAKSATSSGLASGSISKAIQDATFDPTGNLAEVLGADGFRGIPISIIGSLLGMDVPTLFAKEPSQATPSQLKAKINVSKRTGQMPTGYKGSYKPGDVTNSGNFMRADESGIVSGIDPFALDRLGFTGEVAETMGGSKGFRAAGSGVEFSGIKDFIGAVTTPGRQSALTVAEYNAMSRDGRGDYAPGLGGGRALSAVQTQQLAMSGAYYTPGQGLTIPSGGSFSGSLGKSKSFGSYDTGFSSYADSFNFDDDFSVGGGGGFGTSDGGSSFGGGYDGSTNDFSDGGDYDDSFASGGIVRKMAAGGAVRSRDRVPALLEPGEFVIRRPSAKAIGGAALNQMNATGKNLTPPNIQVNLNNQGAPKNLATAEPRVQGDKIIIDMITRDMRNNGPIKKSLRK